jgi:hypothetical protein
VQDIRERKKEFEQTAGSGSEVTEDKGGLKQITKNKRD